MVQLPALVGDRTAAPEAKMNWGTTDLYSCTLTNCIVCEIQSTIICWRSDAQKQLLGSEIVLAGRKVSRAAQLATLHEHCKATV